MRASLELAGFEPAGVHGSTHSYEHVEDFQDEFHQKQVGSISRSDSKFALDFGLFGGAVKYESMLEAYGEINS